jgi:hypothetical protein
MRDYKYPARNRSILPVTATFQFDRYPKTNKLTLPKRPQPSQNNGKDETLPVSVSVAALRCAQSHNLACDSLAGPRSYFCVPISALGTSFRGRQGGLAAFRRPLIAIGMATACLSTPTGLRAVSVE